ncbi:hypothetical protein QQS21_010979 [Conoideocrella luteorostrata]|uniref:Uncharacterized protein n=1 Tax=Conoideocrella luteorostrata TaxID=1105319 RepID=A0AAJ0FNU2_9HYPO|nr:hypothetical protein QQS21_010979 [Conoideocrella luteorostrata]
MPLNFNKLRGSHVLVIGGTSGIGLGITEGVLSSGGTVTIASSSKERVESAVSRLRISFPSSKVAGTVIDLTAENIESSLSNLLGRAAEAQGRLKHIVYTAADAIPSAALASFSAETFTKATRLRVVVPFALAKVVASGDYLDKDRSSSIVLTGGNVAVRPIPDWALVNFIASGLEGAVRGLALDLAPIRVNLVAPGVVDTGLWGDEKARRELADDMKARMPTRIIGQVEDVVEAYLWLLKDGNATGTIARTESGNNLV